MMIAAGVSAALSIFGNLSKNKQAKIQQNALIKGLESYNVAKENQMKSINRKTAFALTNLERKELSDLAKEVAGRAGSGVSGQSALYAYTNFMTQKSINKGSYVAQSEEEINYESQQAHAKYNQIQSGINDVQSKKKSGFGMALDAGSSALGSYTGTGGSMLDLGRDISNVYNSMGNR